MRSLQELSDRLEIHELMARYSHAIDTRQWSALRDVFTDDAVIDYTAFGGPRGSLDEITTFLDGVMHRFPAYQHLVANIIVELAGDRATSRTMCHNPMLLGGARPARLMVCGLWYLDELVRTPAGWRIRERVEEKSYQWISPDTGVCGRSRTGEHRR